MDSSNDAGLTIFRFPDRKENKVNLPSRIPISGIHRVVLDGDLHKVRRCIETGESVNKQEPHYNFSLLHVAVLGNNLELLDYLLAREGVEVDARCSKGRTPLYLATILGHIESVTRLIQAGSDVNISDYENNTAFHVSVYYPHICHLFIERNARVPTINNWGRALHDAVADDCLDIVHMLLYHNIDANLPDTYNRTPFVMALVHDNDEAQKILLEYVDDFDRIIFDGKWFRSILSLALQKNSRFVEDIIQRGVDVNYGDDPRIRAKDCAFSTCVCSPVDLSTFKLVWERLRYNEAKNTIDLLGFLNYVDIVPTFLQVIIDSDNFETAVECFSKGETYSLFVNKFAEKEFDLDQLTALTCRLLEHGFRASSYDIHTIFSRYGYCELFRILLYMDNDFSRGWLPHMVLPRLIFDIDYDLKCVSKQVNDIPKYVMAQLLEYSIYPLLIDAMILKYSNDESMSVILSNLPRVPSLIELARNAARIQIWQAFRITNTCQFYTRIDHLDIPTIYKNILTFKRKIYSVK